MIFLRLFWTFSKIGLFNFGGGYAMLSFIQNEVVVKNGWLTNAEFTDIIAISQMTPGAIGINAATYVGYTSVMNDQQMLDIFGSQPILMGLMAIMGAVLATFSVVWLPFVVMLLVSKLILKYKDSIVTKSIFKFIRPVIIGLLASAVLAMFTDIADADNCYVNAANFGRLSESPMQFVISLAIFVVVFVGCRRWKWNLIYTIIACGVLGVVLFGFVG